MLIINSSWSSINSSWGSTCFASSSSLKNISSLRAH
jgi:hypothetical protein